MGIGVIMLARPKLWVRSVELASMLNMRLACVVPIRFLSARAKDDVLQTRGGVSERPGGY